MDLVAIAAVASALSWIDCRSASFSFLIRSISSVGKMGLKIASETISSHLLVLSDTPETAMKVCSLDTSFVR